MISLMPRLSLLPHASVTRILNQATRHSSPEGRGCLGTRLHYDVMGGGGGGGGVKGGTKWKFYMETCIFLCFHV